NPVEEAMKGVIQHVNNEDIPTEGKIVDDNWSEGKYVATDSPITINGEHKGHVFMFANTNYVKQTVDQLSNQFLMASLITFIFTIVTIFILSRLITHPLIKMKEATENLNRGKHDVKLHTERKDELGELANSITKLANDLEELKMARNEFLASISHELRTPLTYIMGYADVISRPDITEEDRKEYIDIVREETEHLNGLIRNLFELAKIDQNQFIIYREKFVLAKLIHSLAERIKPAYAEKNITLSVSCPPDTMAYIDYERFQQVLLNILDNAGKHSFEGDHVTLEVNEN